MTFIFYSCIITILSAQNEMDIALKKNSFYLSASNLVLWGTAKAAYERQIQHKVGARNFSTYVKIGYGGFATWGAAGRASVVQMNRIYGLRNSHFEVGVGIAHLFDKESYRIAVSNYNISSSDYDQEPTRRKYYWWLPAFDIGYRFQKPGGNFIFRTGLGSPEGVYLSFGLAF